MVQSLNISGIVNAFRILWNPSLAMPHIIVNGKKKEERESYSKKVLTLEKLRHSWHQLWRVKKNRGY